MYCAELRDQNGHARTSNARAVLFKMSTSSFRLLHSPMAMFRCRLVRVKFFFSSRISLFSSMLASMRSCRCSSASA